MISDPGLGADAPAWFGKLACLGDFASRRLRQDVIQALDVWLASGLDISRSQLGDQWMSTYLTSPLWRFAMAPGVLDAQWWFGVMMPSVDSAGRYFPLLILQHSAQAPSDVVSLNQLDQWFSQVAEAALGTLQAGGSLQGFEATLAQAVPLPCGTAPAPWAATPWPDRSRHALAEGETLAACLARMAAGQALGQLHGCTLWWSWRPGTPSSNLSSAVGLPKPESFARLLDGSW